VRAVVVAHGDPEASDRAQCLRADLIVAADGGALVCERWGILPQVVVGDMDSLGRDGTERLRARGARIEAYPRVKDQTDLELAIAAARNAGADEVVIVAAFGGRRLDHEIANVLLLAEGPRVSAVRGGTTMRVIRDGERIALSDGYHMWFVELAQRKVVSGPTHVAVALGYSPDQKRIWVVGERSSVTALRVR